MGKFYSKYHSKQDQQPEEDDNELAVQGLLYA